MSQLNLSAFDAAIAKPERNAEIKRMFGGRGSSVIAIGLVSVIAALLLVMVGVNLVFSQLWLWLAVYLLVVGFVGILIIKAIFGSAVNKVRLRKFAADNGLKYIGSRGMEVPAAGAIFNTGNSGSKFFTSGFERQDGMLAANYQYTVGGGKNSRTYTWGVLRHKLPRRLPNVILDAKSNNSFLGSNLPESYAGGQKLELEGDFGNYFRVLVPEGYGRDALYFLTPELMAHLVDYGKDYEFEIIDDYLYVYSSNDFVFNKQTIPNIFQTIDYFAYQFSDNVKRYADERVPDSKIANVVHVQGSRLKKRFAWVGIVIFILFILLQLLPGILGFFVGDSQ
ncbi:MAG: hypothetical protein WBP26_03910 [Candidatus Saccharimonadales bacterium]